MNKMHNLQKWLHLPHSTVWLCAFNSCITQLLLLLLVFSILIFNISLMFLYSKRDSGRRFTYIFFFKLQVFVILCVCYSTTLLSWGVFRVQHTPLAAWLRSRPTRIETCVLLTDCCCPGHWPQTCPVPEFCPPFLLCLCCCCPCIKCFSLFWSGHTGVHGDCPVVRRRTACVTAARLKYRTAWARCGPKPAGLSWHPVEEMRADWDAARLSGLPSAGAALDVSEGGPRWCSHW